jgi:hypothetical protein
MFQRLKEDPNLSLDSLWGEFSKFFPKKMTKSWIKHLKEIEKEAQSREASSQSIVLDKYLQ